MGNSLVEIRERPTQLGEYCRPIAVRDGGPLRRDAVEKLGSLGIGLDLPEIVRSTVT